MPLSYVLRGLETSRRQYCPSTGGRRMPVARDDHLRGVANASEDNGYNESVGGVCARDHLCNDLIRAGCDHRAEDRGRESDSCADELSAAARAGAGSRPLAGEPEELSRPADELRLPAEEGL